MLPFIQAAFAAVALAVSNAAPNIPPATPALHPLPPRIGIPKPIHPPEDVKTIPLPTRTNNQ